MEKVRIYELAKELGMSNAECLKLCESLGIGVKSHSSSMEEAQADRVRKKAEREGLKKKVPAKEAKPQKSAAAKAVPAKKQTKAAETKTAQTKQKEVSLKAKPKTDSQIKAKKAPAKPKPAPKAPTPKPAPKAPTPKLATKAPTPKAPTPKAPTPKAPASKAPTTAKAEAPPKPKPGDKMPLSRSGKPIPPPPIRRGPGRRTAPPPRRPARRGHPAPNVVLPTGGLPQTSAPTKDDKGPARPLPTHHPRRRKGGRRRRRAPLEELQSGAEPEYSSIDAPVPEGTISIERGSSAKEIAPKFNRTPADMVKFFLEHEETVTASAVLSDEMIELFAMELGAEIDIYDPDEEVEKELSKLLEISSPKESELAHRSPVVTVMGHVDHGKTQLLDTIRNSDVLSGEKGRITQHIGAYQVEHNGHSITFLDTPGHEAFTAMRARGAKATDLVVLVVAADDGVMPQTIEAIQHSKAAGVPILAAINKVDLENSDVSRVLQQLAEQELIPESYGGDTVIAEISALNGTGIDDLLEKLTILAELEELKAVHKDKARGVVLESNLDSGKGPVATFLIQQGTLKVSDPIVAGGAWGRVRALINDKGENIKTAGPSMPVQVLGLSEPPTAGTDFVCAPSESVASKVAERRKDLRRATSLSRVDLSPSESASLEEVFASLKAGQIATLNLIIKADTQGSLEAILSCLSAIVKDNLKIAFVSEGVGGISESDVQLASVSKAIIIGFNVRPDRKSRDTAAKEGIEIRTYEIIYELIEDIEDALTGMLVPEFEEVVTGEADVKEVFRIKGVGFVAGCIINHGKLSKGSGVRFLRDGTIIWRGEIKSLKRFTEDVEEVAAGNECGVGLSDFQDLKKGDVIETFENREVPAASRS